MNSDAILTNNKMGYAKIPYLTNFWPSSLFTHSPLEDTLPSMSSTINKILMTVKNKSLHNLMLTVRPIILLVCRHLLHESKTLKQHEKQEFPLLSSSHRPVSFHFHLWLRSHHCWVVQARELRIMLAFPPSNAIFCALQFILLNNPSTWSPLPGHLT